MVDDPVQRDSDDAMLFLGRQVSQLSHARLQDWPSATTNVSARLSPCHVTHARQDLRSDGILVLSGKLVRRITEVVWTSKNRCEHTHGNFVLWQDVTMKLAHTRPSSRPTDQQRTQSVTTLQIETGPTILQPTEVEFAWAA